MSTFEIIRKHYYSKVNLMGFCHPVDDREYRKYIKQPIDLRVIYEKVMVSAYPTERQFLHDVQTVWSNCLTYCQGRYDNVVLEMNILSKVFREEYDKAFPSNGDKQTNTPLYNTWMGFPPWVRNFESGLCWVSNKPASKNKPVIICEKCDGEYHLHCVEPKLKAVPEGDFICVYCRQANAFRNWQDVQICRKSNLLPMPMPMQMKYRDQNDI